MGNLKKSQRKKKGKIISQRESVHVHTEKNTRSSSKKKSASESIKWQKRMQNPGFREKHRKNQQLRRLQEKEEKICLQNENERLRKRVAFLKSKINQLMEDMFLMEEGMNNKEFEETIIDWHRYIGLDRKIFEKLSNHYSSHYYSLTWEGIERKTIQHKPTLNHRTTLFITLLMFRQYPTGIMLQSIFRVHERTISKIIVRVLSSLHKSFKGQLG